MGEPLWFWYLFSTVTTVGMFVCLRGWMGAVDEACRLANRNSCLEEALRDARDFIQRIDDEEALKASAPPGNP